jgi:hypothetical protein
LLSLPQHTEQLEVLVLEEVLLLDPEESDKNCIYLPQLQKLTLNDRFNRVISVLKTISFPKDTKLSLTINFHPDSELNFLDLLQCCGLRWLVREDARVGRLSLAVGNGGVGSVARY